MYRGEYDVKPVMRAHQTPFGCQAIAVGPEQWQQHRHTPSFGRTRAIQPAVAPMAMAACHEGCLCQWMVDT